LALRKREQGSSAAESKTPEFGFGWLKKSEQMDDRFPEFGNDALEKGKKLKKEFQRKIEYNDSTRAGS